MTEVTLKEYVDRRLEQERELRDQRFADSARSVQLTREEINRRLEGMNELREQIQSERGQFISREVLDKALEVINTKLSNLERFQSNLEGRMWAGALILAAIQILLFWVKK